MIQKAIGVLVLLAWSAIALAQGSGAKTDEAVNPLTQAPFDAFAGVWQRVGIEVIDEGVEGDYRYETLIRLVNLNPSWHSLLIEHLYRTTQSDDAPIFYSHYYTDRLIWDRDGGRIVTGSFRYPHLVVIDDKSGIYITESDDYGGGKKRSVNTSDGQIWTVTHETKAFESDEWVLRSMEKFERLPTDPDLADLRGKSKDKRKIWLKITALPGGSIKSYRLTGDVLEYEYSFGGSGYAKLIVKLTDDQIASIWESLESMGFRDWKRNYSNPGIMDGVHFDFRAVVDGKKIDVRGSNKGPQELQANEDEIGVGLIGVLQSHLCRSITESDEMYLVPGWTEEPTLRR